MIWNFCLGVYYDDVWTCTGVYPAKLGSNGSHCISRIVTPALAFNGKGFIQVVHRRT